MLHVHYREINTPVFLCCLNKAWPHSSATELCLSLSTLASCIKPFVSATDSKKQSSLLFGCRMCSASTSQPGADVTPWSPLPMLWEIKSDVNCLLWQRFSGAQLEELCFLTSLPAPRACSSNSTDYHAGETCSIWLFRNIIRASFKAHGNAHWH